MFLHETNHEETINAFTRQQWQPLLDLIPEIESATAFGQWSGADSGEQGALVVPSCAPGPVVSRFFEIVYGMPVVISFDWGAWDEGRTIASDKDFDLDALDLPTLCKLITAIVRNDRFCEGALVAAFESGLVLRILGSIQKQIADKK